MREIGANSKRIWFLFPGPRIFKSLNKPSSRFQLRLLLPESLFSAQPLPFFFRLSPAENQSAQPLPPSRPIP